MSGLDIQNLHLQIGEPEVLQGVDLHVEQGACIGLVGGSGSGKSLTALTTLGLLPRGAKVTAGAIRLDDREIVSTSRQCPAELRGSEISMIFQSPRSALNPLLRVGRQVERVLGVKGHRSGISQRVLELLEAVGMFQPEMVARLYPHELSGGMCQRIMIAMGVASEPAILLADEPTTALDVTVQREILDLLDRMRARIGMGVLLVSHDLSVIAERCSHIAVMSQGAIVETGTAEQILAKPKHPFTEELVRDLVEAPLDGDDAVPVATAAVDSVRDGDR